MSNNGGDLKSFTYPNESWGVLQQLCYEFQSKRSTGMSRSLCPYDPLYSQQVIHPDYNGDASTPGSSVRRVAESAAVLQGSRVKTPSGCSWLLLHHCNVQSVCTEQQLRGPQTARNTLTDCFVSRQQHT
ncbi:hypothetical protein Q8A73_023604 [Channa argus]|nr:hypothetical protein Q8A73_023604 [Channa argus]